MIPLIGVNSRFACVMLLKMVGNNGNDGLASVQTDHNRGVGVESDDGGCEIRDLQSGMKEPVTRV